LGAIANTASLMRGRVAPVRKFAGVVRSLSGWFFDRLHRRAESQPRLAVVERINLSPRQTLALVEADGQRFLVATPPEGAPAFHPLRSPSPSRRRVTEIKLEGTVA